MQAFPLPWQGNAENRRTSYSGGESDQASVRRLGGCLHVVHRSIAHPCLLTVAATWSSPLVATHGLRQKLAGRPRHADRGSALRSLGRRDTETQARREVKTCRTWNDTGRVAQPAPRCSTLHARTSPSTLSARAAPVLTPSRRLAARRARGHHRRRPPRPRGCGGAVHP